MMKKITFLSLLTCLFFTTTLLAQSTYYVKVGGDGSDGLTEATAFTTINDAVNNALDGDKIIILGAINQSGQVSIEKSLDFEGLNDCIVTATGSSRMYNISNAGIAVSFSNISFQNASAAVQGSVVNITQNSDVSITNCTFKNNTTTSGNGTIFAGATGVLTITNSLFDGNSAPRGGAVAIATLGRKLIVQGSTFVNNSATNDGGAMYLAANNTESSITNTTIFNNNAVNSTLNQSKGGGLRIEGTRPFLIQNSLIYGNTVTDGSTGTADSDIGITPATVLSFVNSISKKIEPALDGSDVVTLSNMAANLTSSNLAYDAASGLVKYTLPTTGDDSPIDFGSDGNDVGAWNSGFTLSLDREDFLATQFTVFFNKASKNLEVLHTINAPLSVEIYNIIGAKVLTVDEVASKQSINANGLKAGIYILLGKTPEKFFSKKFIVN
ncbi:MAG: T9SS type A sorting domain-containing protein [Flavobacteriaceae bacterium]|nr:T9SS type A sorting domain-containing protein [Flavobacteriaceae bacterium]